MSNLFNKNICANCPKGEKCCCKTYGCRFSPDDFQLSEKMSNKEVKHILKINIDKKYISIDFANMDDTDLDNNYFYLRMRHLGAPIIDVDSKGGVCCKLGKNGCYFSDEERPKGGKFLIPDEKGNCISKYPFKKVIDWEPYQDVLIELLNEYKKVSS